MTRWPATPASTGWLAGGSALLAALAAPILTGTGAGSTLAGVAGLLLVGVGLARRRAGAVSLGASGLFAGTLLGGVSGVGAPSVVTAAAATVVAWTAGRTSIQLRNEFGGVVTVRLEAVHVAGTTVLVGGAGALVLLPGLAPIQRSPLGLVLVVVGGVAVAAALAVE